MTTLHGENVLIDRLSELVDILRLNRFGDDTLWTLSDIAEFFRYGEGHARRIIQRTPSFPKPVKISEGGKRWIAREVKEWVTQHRARASHKAGRPRAVP